MNARKWLALLAPVLVFGTAWGQGPVQDGSRFSPTSGSGARSTHLQGNPTGGVVRADSTFQMLTMDGSGNLKVTFTQPYDNNGLFQSVIANSGLAVAAADSSGVLDVHQYRYLKLLVKAYLTTGASNGTARLAIQLREHMNGAVDSSSTFAEYPYMASNQGVAMSLVDTTLTGHLLTGSATAPWSGEILLNVAGVRGAPGSAVAATAFSYPNGISIPVDMVGGRYMRFKNLSIRVRNLSGQTCAITISVLGFSE